MNNLRGRWTQNTNFQGDSGEVKGCNKHEHHCTAGLDSKIVWYFNTMKGSGETPTTAF